MTHRSRRWRLALLALVGGFGAPAVAADIVLKNAWMQPAAAGAAKAGVYLDLRTDVSLKLVGATSPMAKSVAIVLVDRNPNGTLAERTVKEVDLPGGKELRFAFNGDRLELRDIGENLTTGAFVPLTLHFVEGPNLRPTVEIGVLVRGVIPPPEGPAAKPN